MLTAKLCMAGLTLLCGTVCAAGMEHVRVSKDGAGFILAKSQKPFRVWGVNYDHDSTGEHGRLIEDYWHDEWETVRADFREMKELGANVVRIHLQFAKFMTSAETPDERSLGQLRRLLALAEETGLYLDITGLGCYHKADTPAWYDDMDEEARWAAQARFWAAIAKTCRTSPAVFCYDLMNEPVVGGDMQGWVGGELGGKCFVQRITRTPGKRTPAEVAAAWVKKLTAAIRAEDPEHLITVGVIPWAHTWPGAKPVFYSPEAAASLDFVSIHLYPDKGQVDKALAALATYDIGKPLVIEETFPLSCGIEEMDDFLRRSRGRVEGYLSFYWGKTIEEYEVERARKIQAAIVGDWLKHFRKLAPEMK